MPNKWINFAELRKQLSLTTVLQSYDIELIKKAGSEQFVGACPLPGHPAGAGDKKSKSFSANAAKGVWQCFGCKASGNVIDFAVLMEGLDKSNGNDVRRVALQLHEKFVKRLPSESAAAVREATRQERADASASVAVNAPLNFQLKTLERDHLYFAARKLTAQTVEKFGLGFCKRGSLAGRIAIPLHDDSAQLIGYAGLALGDEFGTAGDEGRSYLFPGDREIPGTTHRFDRGLFLYNGFRVARSASLLFLVRECAEVWALAQAGFANAVATMGEPLTEDQAEVISLMTPELARIWIVTDSSDAGEAMARSALMRLATSRLVRWVRIAAEGEIAVDHPVLATLPRK